MKIGTAIGLGAVIGLALGIVVSVTTDVPLAPEVGLVLGALLGWLAPGTVQPTRRRGETSTSRPSRALLAGRPP